MAVISYADYAINDYMYLCETLKYVSDYNHIAVSCQQIVERILKGVLLHSYPEDTGIIKLIETTHSIKNLCDSAVKVYPSLAPLTRVSTSLTRYYIAARYPTDIPSVISHEEVCKLCTVTTKVVNWFFEKADFKLVYITYKHLLNAKDDKLKNYSGSPKDRQKFKDLIGVYDLPKPLTGIRFWDTDTLDPDFSDE